MKGRRVGRQGRGPWRWRSLLLALGLGLLPTADTGLAEPLPAADRETLGEALGIYEALRAELAADRVAGLAAEAEALAAVFSRLEAGGSEALAAALERATAGTEALAGAADLDAARVRFGDLSQALLEIAALDDSWLAGWHVFACPMVESFPKWLQASEEMANPYMGPSMLQCGFATDRSIPASFAAPEAAKSPDTAVAATPEPVFEPGIAGLRMVDVRDHKFLWREIEQLQGWERADLISVAELRSKAIEKTAHFLELEGEELHRFESAAAAAIGSVRSAFHRRQAEANSSGVEGAFSELLREASTSLAATLGEAPRHRLFAPDCKKWLLKLAFGPKESKEARESASP